MVNVFAPSTCPKKSAHALDKKRLSRMCFESYEALSSVILRLSPKIPEFKKIKKKVYRSNKAHIAHPVVDWIMEDRLHFQWVLEHAQALNEEYMVAYRKADPCEPFKKIDRIARYALKYLPETRYEDNDLQKISFRGFFNYNYFRSDAKPKYDGDVVLKDSISIQIRYQLYLLHKWFYLDKRITEWSGLPPVWAFNPLYHEWLQRHFGKPKKNIPQLHPKGSGFIQSLAANKARLSLHRIGQVIANKIKGVAVRHREELRDSTAVFNDNDRQEYRYYLARQWDQTIAPLVVIMLNPSTADAFKNDPTVQLIENLARYLNYGGYVVLNVAAYRATDPKDMLKQKDPIGKHNRTVIFTAIRQIIHRWNEKPSILLAYGNNIEKIPNGVAFVESLIEDCNDLGTLLYLELTKRNHPRHPLYFDTSKRPQRYLPW